MLKFEKKSVAKRLINREKSFFTSAAHQIWTHKKISSRQRIKTARDLRFRKNDFLRITADKIKERAFVGLQIRELTQDVKYGDQLSEVGKAAWKCHYHFGRGGDRKAEKCRDMVAYLVQSYKAMGCIIFLYLPFLDSLLHVPRKSWSIEP